MHQSVDRIKERTSPLVMPDATHLEKKLITRCPLTIVHVLGKIVSSQNVIFIKTVIIFEFSQTDPDANEFRLPLSATTGHCNSECQNTKLFVFLFAFFVFMHSTSEVGSMLLIMRCVHPKDKAMAMGVIQFAIGLFGNIPCPIIYGAVGKLILNFVK